MASNSIPFPRQQRVVPHYEDWLWVQQAPAYKTPALEFKIYNEITYSRIELQLTLTLNYICILGLPWFQWAKVRVGVQFKII